MKSSEIKALAKIELTDIEQRAIHRFVQQEAKKQENIERITAEAAASLPPDAKVEGIEEDWITHFFKQCDGVSDREMQSLWSRLLSGEATKPGTFSKRTVDFVSTIDKRDADLFTKICQFIWVVGDPVPLIYETQDDIYAKNGITFDSLKHLDAIGLISFESVSGYARMGFNKYAHVLYFGRQTAIEFQKEENNQISIGQVLLTSIGKELVSICGAHRNEDFYHHVIGDWYKKGLILSTVGIRHA